MNISEISIRHHVFAWMLMAALIIFGALAFRGLGVSQNPDIDFPNVNISLRYEGAAPEVMEKDVVDPVEAAIVSIQGIKKISSSVKNGTANVSVEFVLQKDIDVAVQEVQAAIARAQRNLPDGLEPATITKSNPEDQPIMWLAVRSEKLAKKDLMFLVRGQIRDQFSTVPGVGEITLGGYVDPALRVDLSADALARYQLTVDDIVNSIQREHREDPAGRISTAEKETAIRVMGEANNPEEFRQVIIKRRGGGPNFAPIPLTEVAEISEGLSEVRRISRALGESAVGLGIRKQRGANAVEVGDAVKAKMLLVQKQLPEDVKISVNFDTTPFVRESVNELIFTIGLAALLTALVCWVFLGSWSSTLNVILAIPTSIVGTFFVMKILGFTLNTFSLLGLSLAIGIVVDDAIIVLENIMRHFEQGKSRWQAALDGSREITFAVLATTFSLIAIFLPVAFMEGIIGKFFYQFSITLCVAVVLSLLEALTIAPMRCSQFLQSSERRTRLGRGFEQLMNSTIHVYQRWLPIVLEHRYKVLGLALTFFCLSLLLLPKLKKEFAPSLDEGSLFVQFRTPLGSSMSFTDAKAKEIEEIIKKNPNIIRYFLVVGGFQGGESNSGFFFVTLRPANERVMDPSLNRKPSHLEVADSLRGELKTLREVRAFIPTGGGGVFGGGRGTYAVEFSIRGPDWDELVKHSEQITAQMNQSGLFTDVSTPDVKGAPEIRLVPNRTRARQLGVEIADISRAVRALIGGQPAALYSKGGQRYDVLVQLREADRLNIQQLDKLFVRNNRGELVRISELVNIESRTTPPTIFREDRIRAISINANLAKGVSQDNALDSGLKIASEVLPVGYFAVLGGSAQVFSETRQSLLYTLLLGILVVYMVLAAQFNSFLDPVVILVALPFALSGALLGLFVSGQSLNMYSFIGVILLIGLVKKNSILLVDFTNQLRAQGLSVRDALSEACPQRLRPIIMTSFSTLAAAIPGALNFGPGAETRIPMSVVVIGGMIVATVFTLFVVPCLYMVMSRTRRPHPDQNPHERRPTETHITWTKGVAPDL